MLQINILYVGNIKDKFYAEAVQEYEKRLSAFCKIKNIELKEEKPPENPSDAEIALVIKKEGDRLLEAMPNAPPMMKVISESPATVTDSIFFARSSEEICVPSTQRAIL